MPDPPSDSFNSAELSSTKIYPEEVIAEVTIDSEAKEELLITQPIKKGIFRVITATNSLAQKFYGDYFSAFAALVGVSGFLMGFLTSIRNLISSLFQGFFGPLSDRFGRKTFMLVGLALSFVVTTLLIFFGSPAILVVVAIIQSLAICVFTPTFNAAIGDVTTQETRGSFIGKLSALGQIISVGSSLILSGLFYLVNRYQGYLVMGWIVNIPWEIQYAIAFALSAICYIFSIIAVAFMKETNIYSETTSSTKRNPFDVAPFKDRYFLTFLVVHLIFSLLMSIVWPLFPIIQIRVLNMQLYQIAITSASFAVCMGIFQIIGGRLADKIGRKKIIIIGAAILVFFPVSYTPAIITGQWFYAIIPNIIAGSGSGFFYTTINTYILDLAPTTKMGSYIGWKETLVGIATFIGSLSGGAIIDALTNKYGLIIMGIAMAIGVSILRLLALGGYFFFKESLTFTNSHNLNHLKKQ